MNYDWKFSRLEPYTTAFLYGTGTTIALTLVVILVGTLVGVVWGLALTRRRMGIVLYPIVDVVRAIPLLVLLLFMYYLLTYQVIGVAVSSFTVAVVAMSVNLAAFTADLVRSAAGNVNAASVDAAMAMGLSRGQTLRHVILPSVVRELIPPMTVLYIAMLKMSSLAAIINVGEIVFTAKTVIADIARSLEAWVIVAVIYVVLVVPATYGSRVIERWAKRGCASRPIL